MITGGVVTRSGTRLRGVAETERVEVKTNWDRKINKDEVGKDHLQHHKEVNMGILTQQEAKRRLGDAKFSSFTIHYNSLVSWGFKMFQRLYETS